MKRILNKLLRILYIMSFEKIISSLGEFASSVGDYIQDFFVPPDKIEDYYSIGRFAISKKLFKLIFWIFVIAAATYLIFVGPEILMKYADDSEDNQIYTKYHDSRSLKSYTGVAEVVSKRSDAKYVGDIEGGLATGKGILYDGSGMLLYDGEFRRNEYNGEGTLYYDSDTIKYIGNFRSNLFEGVGKLYYPSGRINYEGDFVAGIKNGVGVLFSESGNELFSGSFANDRPFLEKYLNNSILALSNSFLETGTMYVSGQRSSIIYKDIGVMAVTHSLDNSVEYNDIVEQIYILNNKHFENIPVLDRKSLDQEMEEKEAVKDYTGYTRVTFAEASIIDYMRKVNPNDYKIFSKYEFKSDYEGVLEFLDTSFSDKLFVQSYDINNIRYNFYFADRDEKYVFYSIERLD